MQKEFLLSLIAGVLVLLFVVGTNRKPQSAEDQQTPLPPKYVKIFLATVVATFLLLLLLKQASSKEGPKPRAGKPGRAMNAEQRMLDTVLSNIDLAEPGF